MNVRLLLSIGSVSIGLLLGLLSIAKSATSQSRLSHGDVVVADWMHVYGITAQGQQNTVVSNAPFLPASAVLPAPDNNGVIVVGTSIARVAMDGTVTTLFRIGVGMGATVAAVNGVGDILLGGQDGRPWFHRVQPTGRVTTFADGSSAIARGLVGGGFDPTTGDLIVAGRSSTMAGLFRVTTGAIPAVTPMRAFPIASTSADGSAIHHDPATGDLVLFNPFAIHRVSPTPPYAATTLLQGGPLGTVPCPFDYDPTRGDFVLGSGYTTIPNPNVGVLRFDAATGAATTLRAQIVGQISGVTVAGTRNLCGLTVPTIGSSYQMLVSSPAESGARYVVALSAAPRPGIQVPGIGRIDLAPDPLFFLSLSGSPIFRGFQGVLDASGEARPSVNIPAIVGLRGLRFFASAITIVQGRVSTIAETIGATIR